MIDNTIKTTMEITYNLNHIFLFILLYAKLNAFVKNLILNEPLILALLCNEIAHMCSCLRTQKRLQRSMSQDNMGCFPR